MSLLAILRWPDPMLSRVCAPVTGFTPDLHILSRDMLETMYGAPGRGLAAPQVGHALRLFVMDPAWKTGRPEPLVCFNPEILDASPEMQENEEGCLSIPGLPLTVRRAARITLNWQDERGAHHSAKLDGVAAAIAQHELDHLDGIVIFDRVAPDGRSALERRYLDGVV